MPATPLNLHTYFPTPPISHLLTKNKDTGSNKGCASIGIPIQTHGDPHSINAVKNFILRCIQNPEFQDTSLTPMHTVAYLSNLSYHCLSSLPNTIHQGIHKGQWSSQTQNKIPL